jgi:hypothetical protein
LFLADELPSPGRVRNPGETEREGTRYITDL